MRWCAIVVRRNRLFFWASSKTKEENVFLDNPLSSRRDEPVFDARIFFRKTGGRRGARSCPAVGSAELWRLWKRVFLVQHNYTRIQTRAYIRMYIARQMEKRLGGYFIFSSSNHWKIRTRVCASHVRKIRLDTGRTYLHTVHHVK